MAGYGRPIIVDEKNNGSLLVMIQAQGKMRIDRIKPGTEHPFLVCEGVAIEENSLLEDRNIEVLAGLYRVLRRWVHHHVADPMQREIFMSKLKTPQDIVGHFCAYLVRDNDLQQYLLEEDNINNKVWTLVRLLESNELSA